jgi:hypothetical protein
MALIDKFSNFIKSSGASPRMSREEAGKAHLDNGGILKTDGDRLIFPDKNRIISQLEETAMRKDNLTAQLRFWQRQYRPLAGNVLEYAYTATDPLFWEHMFKMSTERKYKDSFKKVDLPIKYMREEKYRKVIKAFVRDEQYRKNLVSAKTSIVGKSGDSIKSAAEKGKEFKRKIIEEKIKKIKHERDYFLEREAVLLALLDWSLGHEIKQEGPVEEQKGSELKEDGQEKD